MKFFQAYPSVGSTTDEKLEDTKGIDNDVFRQFVLPVL